jgi:hypothetical protein
MTDGPTARDRIELEVMLRGFMISRMLRLVADIGVADRIPADGQVAVCELARACDVQEEPLLRVLRSLASVGVFRLSPQGVAGHTAKSVLLRTDVADSAHYAARFWSGPGSWGAWGRLDAALTGGVPHEAAWGMGRFAYLRDHSEEARAFVVAGLAPDAVLAGRIQVVAGSFLDAVPAAGADHVLLSRVLHDWPDAECVRILGKCRAAMAPGALLLLIEGLLEPDPERGKATDYLIDMQMMAMFGAARERT